MTQLANPTPMPGPGPGSGGQGARVTAAPPNRLFVIVAAVLVVFVIAYFLLHHHNKYENLADRVTQALANNNMQPVAEDFNAIPRAKLANRGEVGRLSDFVNAEGKFKGVKEDTPGTAQPGYHHFVAHFDKGDLSEDLTVDADGKIAAFHVRPAQQ
jgi:hypothetical protein